MPRRKKVKADLSQSKFSKATESTSLRRSQRIFAGNTKRWRDDASIVSNTASSSSRCRGRPKIKQIRKVLKPWDASDEEDSEKFNGFRHLLSSDEEEDDTESEEAEEILENSSYFSDEKNDRNLSDIDVDLEEDLADNFEGKNLPRLDLPTSSIDVLVDTNLLMDVLETYEVLKNFTVHLQLSPLLFEDFCAALRSPRQSRLLCDIHVAFLRLLFREEENEHTTFTVQDTSFSFGIMVQLLDPMNYAEVLRHYVGSDPSFSREVLHILQTTNYPFTDTAKRLTVIKWLCDRFFDTDLFKKIMSGAPIKHDDQCRYCGKNMVVAKHQKSASNFNMECNICEAVYHAQCAEIIATENGLEELGSSEFGWLCPLCRIEVPGVTDSILPNQTDFRNLNRIEPLGRDRHGRIYWFLARRIFVQDVSNNELYYYSTLPQLHDLIAALDPRQFERRLCVAFHQLLPTIAVQMHKTLELTDERRRNKEEQTNTPNQIADPFLQLDNVQRMSRIIYEIHAGVNNQSEENNHLGQDAFFGTSSPQNELVQTLNELLCIEEGHMAATFWSFGMDEKQLLDYYNDLDKEDGLPPEELQSRLFKGFRLGFSDGCYLHYVNYYANNDLGKSPAARVKERERRKYIASRFCIADEGEFAWSNPKLIFGAESDIYRCIQQSLTHLVERLPEGLMHRLWKKNDEKKRFLRKLAEATNISTLRNLLLFFEAAIRRPVFLPIFWQSLAVTSLARITSEDREIRQKMERIRKKEEKALQSADASDRSICWVKYSLFGGPPKHNVWRLKDEQFRINGFESLGGWLWRSATLTRTSLPLPEKPELGIKREQGPSIATKKATRLRRLANKLAMWRLLEHYRLSARDNPYACYSSNCRLICSGTRHATAAFTSLPQESANHLYPPMRCYRSNCPRNAFAISQPPTDAESTAALASAKPVIREETGGAEQQGVMGEDCPFPIPSTHDFRSRSSGKRSILILPKWFLRKLARQGGLSPETSSQFFHQTAKSNTSWPYPAPRPLFFYCWRYLTAQANSLHAIALRFRTLFCCIRWMDLEPDPDDEDPRVWTHQPDCDEVRVVVGHRENPPDGYYEQYKIRVEQYSLEETPLDDDSADFRPTSSVRGTRGSRGRGRGGTRKRPLENGKRQQHHRLLQIVERWIDGVELKLYEIDEYWEAWFNRETAASKREGRQVVNGAQQSIGEYLAQQHRIKKWRPQQQQRQEKATIPRTSLLPILQLPKAHTVHHVRVVDEHNNVYAAPPEHHRPLNPAPSFRIYTRPISVPVMLIDDRHFQQQQLQYCGQQPRQVQHSGGHLQPQVSLAAGRFQQQRHYSAVEDLRYDAFEASGSNGGQMPVSVAVVPHQDRYCDSQPQRSQPLFVLRRAAAPDPPHHTSAGNGGVYHSDRNSSHARYNNHY